MSQIFNRSAIERLEEYRIKKNKFHNIEQLTPDASTREFFRLFDNDFSSIACVYAEPFDRSLPQIDVTNLFLKADLPVAEIYDVDFDLGIVLHEDFGDLILRDKLLVSDKNTRDDLINRTIKLLAKIQSSTPIAFEVNSIASKLKFDEEKLVWELNFFIKHYFGSLNNKPLNAVDDGFLMSEFIELSKELESYANVLTHRDFHAANLMINKENELVIIDHQDARLGSVAYDLVSLLLDRITELPTQNWLKIKKEYFLIQREKLGLATIDYEVLNNEFELMTIQRCLKAIGTFSNQAGNLGKKEYIQYIEPMFEAVSEACKRLQRFPNLQRIINIELLK